MARVWLDVPYEEKDAAKAGGARWDPQALRWYAPWHHNHDSWTAGRRGRTFRRCCPARTGRPLRPVR